MPVWSDEPHELLDEGIFAETARGDLDSAVRAYLGALASTNSQVRAQARFGLASCYRKQGDLVAATIQYETLVADHGDEKALVERARRFLAKRLPLQPVPWRDGERLQYRVELHTGVDIGTLVTTTTRVTDKGIDCWQFQSYDTISASGPAATRAVVDADSFLPTRSFMRHARLGAFRILYDHGTARLEARRSGKQTIKEMERGGPVYDYEQVWHLVRRLPMKVGFKIQIPLLVHYQGEMVDAHLHVVKEETVESMGEQVRCAKIDVTIPKWNIEESLWISLDENRYLVQFGKWSIRGRLVSVGTTADMHRVDEERLGMSLVAPKDWSLLSSEQPATSPVSMTVNGISPDALAAYQFMRLRVMEDAESLVSETPRDRAERCCPAKLWPDEYQEYVVDPESWESLTIDGRAAISYRATYIRGAMPHRIYAVYIPDDVSPVLVVADYIPENEEACLAEFQPVLRTMKFK